MTYQLTRRYREPEKFYLLIVFLLFFLLVTTPAGVRLRCFHCVGCQAVQSVSSRGSGPIGSNCGAVSSDQYLDPGWEAMAFTPWWMLNYIWYDTGVFLLVFFLLIFMFRWLLEPQTGDVGAQSLRIV